MQLISAYSKQAHFWTWRHIHPSVARTQLPAGSSVLFWVVWLLTVWGILSWMICPMKVMTANLTRDVSYTSTAMRRHTATAGIRLTPQLPILAPSEWVSGCNARLNNRPLARLQDHSVHTPLRHSSGRIFLTTPFRTCPARKLHKHTPCAVVSGHIHPRSCG